MRDNRIPYTDVDIEEWSKIFHKIQVRQALGLTFEQFLDAPGLNHCKAVDYWIQWYLKSRDPLIRRVPINDFLSNPQQFVWLNKVRLTDLHIFPQIARFGFDRMCFN